MPELDSCAPILRERPNLIHHVYAMQRSGHHAVMQWLMDSYSTTRQTADHVNDVYHGHLPQMVVCDPTPGDILRQGRGSDVLFVNYEDVVYERRYESAAYADLQEGATGTPTKDIVVVRDWFNLAASRFQSQVKAEESGKPLQLHPMEWDEVREIWKEYAQTMLQTAVDEQGPLAVSYNRWFVDGQYRRKVAGLLGLPSIETHLNKVPEFGNGSSFDGVALNGVGRQMNVLRRWDNIAPARRAAFLAIAAADPEVDELNRQVFGFGFTQLGATEILHA